MHRLVLRSVVVAVAVVAFAACAPDEGEPDAGGGTSVKKDAGASDAGTHDAGPGDGGFDAGETDAGETDAGETDDAGENDDAGELDDAGTSDAGESDAGETDAGELGDAGENDDAGDNDAGENDDAGDNDAGDNDAGENDGAGDNDAGDNDAGDNDDAGELDDAGESDAGQDDAGQDDDAGEANTGPTLVWTDPPADATDVALDATIELTFSEPVLVPDGAIEVTQGTDPIAGTWTVVGPTVTFTPTSLLLDDTTYTVTLTTAVTDLVGNPLAFETSFELTTRARQWSASTPLPGGEGGWNPSFAMNESGRAVLAWDVGNADVYAAIFDPASGWSEPVLLDVPELGAASRPAAAIDPAGIAHVAWAQNGTVSTPRRIYVRRLVPGEEWSVPVGVSPLTGHDFPEAAAITVDVEGSATVAWTSEWFTSTSVAAVYAARMEGGDWTLGGTLAQQIGRQYTLTSRAKPERIVIGTDAYTDGVRPRTVAVWDHGIYLVGNHADPSWSTAAQVDVETQSRARSPALAMAANGVAVATWFVDDSTPGSLDYPRYAVFRPGTGWSAKKGLGTVKRVIEPVVALDDDAAGVIAFLGVDTSNRPIVQAGVYRDNGSDAGAILTTNLYTGTRASTVQVAARGGRGLLAYQREAADTTNAMVVRSVDLATSAFSGEQVIDDSAENAQFLQLGMDGAGGALLVWRDGTRLVWSRYE